MTFREIGRERGRKAGAKVKGSIQNLMTSHEAFIRQLFPTIPDMDLRAAWRDYDRERLAGEPDYQKLPEARGLIERHLGEREGFREAAGCDETAAAFHFSADWFWQKRLNSHHVARWDLVTIPDHGCTNVFIPDGVEGVTIGDNRDVPLPGNRYAFRDWQPSHLSLAPDKELKWVQGGVSSAILLDEEPKSIFPINVFELMPDECRDDLKSIMEFMTRYSEYWGPCKQLWLDRKLKAIGVEKSNCRIGFIPADPQTGAVAVTACSFITPGLHEYRDECFKSAAQLKGESLENNLDWVFVQGGDARQHRLTELTIAEARRGATIWSVLENVVGDHAVPYPSRVCLGGERSFDVAREPLSNWSVTQHAAVLTGPNRRALYRSVEDTVHPIPVYDSVPKLRLGVGVAMRPEWQADVDAGRCVLGGSVTVRGQLVEA